MNTNTLRKWLAEGKTGRVVEALLDPSAQIDADLRQEATLLSARYETLAREKRLGTIEYEQESRERAQINAGLLEIIEKLPQEPPQSGILRSKWLKIGSAVVVLAGLLGSIADFSGFSLRDLFGNKEQAARVEPAPGLPNDTRPSSLPENNKPQQQVPEKSGPAPARTEAPLSIQCKSNKGRLNLHFKSGETMRFYIRVNRPCTVRSIYKLADGRLVLLDNDRAVSAAEPGRWLEIGAGFEAAEPFGEERIFVFAQNPNSPFPALQTRTDADGYRFITEGLPEALAKTRGFKQKQSFAEDEMGLSTHL